MTPPLKQAADVRRPCSSTLAPDPDSTNAGMGQALYSGSLSERRRLHPSISAATACASGTMRGWLGRGGVPE